MQLGQLCYPGEKTDTCVIGVARSAPDTIFDLADKGLHDAGQAIGDGIDTIDDAIEKVKDACERHLSGCGTAIPV